MFQIRLQGWDRWLELYTGCQPSSMLNQGRQLKVSMELLCSCKVSWFFSLSACEEKLNRTVINGEKNVGPPLQCGLWSSAALARHGVFFIRPSSSSLRDHETTKLTPAIEMADDGKKIVCCEIKCP